MPITITEALAEIKTIKARILKKRASVVTYFARDARLKDPLEKEGGTRAWSRTQMQSIHDLEARLVAIRCAIQEKNLATPLTLDGETKSLSAWLVWRREVSAEAKNFVETMSKNVGRIRNEALQQEMRDRTATSRESPQIPEVEFALDEAEIARMVEAMETRLGSLDGRLSLLNATVQIDLPDAA